jgi:hypothetical protein
MNDDPENNTKPSQWQYMLILIQQFNITKKQAISGPVSGP